jgi:hypothetical protein
MLVLSLFTAVSCDQGNQLCQAVPAWYHTIVSMAADVWINE